MTDVISMLVWLFHRDFNQEGLSQEQGRKLLFWGYFQQPMIRLYFYLRGYSYQYFQKMTENTTGRSISSHDAVSNLIKYSDSHQNLIHKYTVPFFLNYFDRYTIEELEEKMGKKMYNELQFVRELSCFVLHGGDQTLFLVMGLMEIYVRIVAEVNRQDISVKDFTQFLCAGIQSEHCELSLHNKEIPLEAVRANSKKVRDIDVNPAIIYSCPEKQSPQISKCIKKKEKRVDTSKPLHIFYPNRKKREILTLGRLAAHISIFNLQLNKIRDIVPNCFKEYNRNGAIMSMVFSEKQQRIGCLVTHVGLAFWDYEDDFVTQKLIRNEVGDKIWFLEVLQEWITTTTNTIYLWDLKLQKIKNNFCEPNALAINDMKEISHLRCLAVSYTMKDQHKWVFVYKNESLKVGSRMKTGHAGGQKIHYHQGTQTVLLYGGKQLEVYEIDQLSLDLSLISELKGHQTMITCIADLQEGCVVTGDDRGTLRVWDINSLRCQQVLKVANSLISLEFLDNTLIFGDSRLNVMQLEQLKQKVTLKDQYGISKFYNFQSESPEIFIFTNVSCRVYSLSNGRIKRVIELCTPQEEIIAVESITDGFLVSTSRAVLQCFSKDFKLKWKMNANQFKEEILHIRADHANKLFTTVGKEGNFNVWNEKTLMEEGPRKSIINGEKKYSLQIRVFDLSEKYGVMVSGEKNPHLKIWDYESCKLCHVVELQAPACSLKIGEKYPLLAVGCLNQKIYLYKMSRREIVFEVNFLQFGNLRYPQMKLNSLLSVDSASQMTLSPLRKALETKTIVSKGIVFHHRGETSLIAISYGRGNVLVYDISDLQSHFTSEATCTRRAVNILRPVKEHFDKQISKNQYRRTQKVKQESLSSYNKLKVAWNKKIHRDVITHIDACQNNYLSTLSLDGYYKIISVEKGQILGVLSIQHPLPTLWKVQFTQEEQICKKVYQALTLVSEILHHKETTREEKRMFDVCPLMKQICTKSGLSAFRKKRKSVRLLKDQIGNQENNWAGEESLKSMEAFRRVSLIRESTGNLSQCDFTSQKKNMAALKEKGEMMKLLSPFHFPNRYPQKWYKQEQQKFDLKVAKSAHVSPTYSPEKQKEKEAKPLLDSINRKIFKHHLGRSLSQKLQKLDNLLTSASVCGKSRESQATKDPYAQMKTFEPMRAISNFIKDLNSKVPKDAKFKKHLKKRSGIAPIF